MNNDRKNMKTDSPGVWFCRDSPPMWRSPSQHILRIATGGLFMAFGAVVMVSPQTALAVLMFAGIYFVGFAIDVGMGWMLDRRDCSKWPWKS